MDYTHIAYLESRKPKTNHILHLLLTLVTGGIWIVVWVFAAASNKFKRQSLDREIKRVRNA